MLFKVLVVGIIVSLLDYARVRAQVSAPGAISKFAPGGQYIMLTFSGGPHHIGTAKVLDILKAKKVKATFFVSGWKASHHNNLLERMHKEGHEIGNHGYYQQIYTRLPHENIVGNLNETSKLISSVTNAKVKHARPPMGITNAEINQLLKQNGDLKVILWSLDSQDGSVTKSADITSRLLKKAAPGDIILMHDSLDVAIEALPDIIDGLYKQGYEFLTIAEVAAFPDDSPK